MRPELHLLRRVAARPPGEKVPVGRLAREFGVTQALILDMIGWLVRAGRLDPATLRLAAPPHKNTGVRGNDVPAAELLPEIERFLAEAKMSPSRFGIDCMRDPRFVLDMMTGKRPRVLEATAEKVRRFIAEWTDPEAGFKAQLQRVERGEVGIAPAFAPRKAMPDQTFGGVTGEIG
jgi:hypothetical protein